MKQIKRYELEITSLCNAECHVCHRTKNMGKYELTSLTLEDIKNIFPLEEDLTDFQFLFCGALGDPIANKQCYEIVEHLARRGAFVELNSNTSLQTADWWRKLGELSKETKKVTVWFCVDGHRETNHIYRKNTDFDIIERNMEAYANAGGLGRWVYIQFDHNEHEIDIAKEHAAKLNLSFSLRKGAANANEMFRTIKKKDKITKEVKIEERLIVATGENKHSKLDQIKILQKFVQGDKNDK